MTTCGGGPVATALCAAAAQGAVTALIDSTGDTSACLGVLAGLETAGVSVAGVTRHPGHTPPRATILVRRRDAARAIAYLPSDAPELVLTAQQRALIAACRFLHLNGRHLEACNDALTIAHEAGTKVSFDGGAGRYRPALLPLLQAAHLPALSLEFATAATGHRDPGAAVRALSTPPHVELAVVTNGIDGAWFSVPGGGVQHQPAFLLENTADTTGAGDVFHGVLLAALAGNASAAVAVRRAAAAAALSTTALGGRPGIPNRDGLDDFLDKHQDRRQ